MYVQNEIDFDYSFRKQFNNWGLFKKFIAIVFLPFVPIYSVSKGFQMRKWKKYGGNYPPGMTKYVILMAVAYYFTVFPMLIGFLWILFQLYLFWLSFIIAFYLNRKDLEEIDKDLIVETEDFKLIGFRKLSITFLVLFGFSFFFSIFGLFWVFTFTALLFIVFPVLYRLLYYVPRELLFLSNPFMDFLSILPGVHVTGDWFIEKDSEVKKLTSIYDVMKFIISNYQAFFIINVGISALAIRLILLLRELSGNNFDVEDGILNSNALSSWGFYMVFFIVPIFMAIYFVWVFVWQDAELKVAKTKISTASKYRDGQEIVETTRLTLASDSITRMFSLLFGVPIILWLVAENARTPPQDFISEMSGLLGILIVFFIFTGMTIIFMGVMYYRSGVHEDLVNKLRNHVIEMNKGKDPDIKICYSSVTQIAVPVE